MIVNQILEHLKTGRLKVGDKLPSERELCKMFGVGRSSVREAIRALVVMGNLEVLQGKGTFMSQTVDTVNRTFFLESRLKLMPVFDLMEARQMLEINVVKLVTDRVDQMDILYMHQAITWMAESEDVKCFLEAAFDFHKVLTESTGNLVIGEMMKEIIKMLHKDSCFVDVLMNSRENSISSARQIVQLMARGEGEKAAEAMRIHLGVVNASLISMISGTSKGKREKVEDQGSGAR
ncbi:MAG: GntR family transcriptional regulator [Dehalobacterium sp.]